MAGTLTHPRVEQLMRPPPKAKAGPLISELCGLTPVRYVARRPPYRPPRQPRASVERSPVVPALGFLLFLGHWESGPAWPIVLAMSNRVALAPAITAR
jgi:hypothetical protein